MPKLCIIYNFAQKYREAVYRLIDKEWNCDWYFGTNNTDIEGFDLSSLKHTQLIENITIRPPFYYQKGVLRILKNKSYNTFLMLGEFNSISTWLMLFLKPFIAPKKKIYFWTHGWYGREGTTKKLLKRLFFGMADGIFLYGNYARRLMIEEGFDPDKLFVIHNSLDYDNQRKLRLSLSGENPYLNHFGNSNPNLIFVGRLTKVKRIDMILESVKRLSQEGFDVNLTLIGDGSETSMLRAMAESLMISDKVWFYGACYDDNKNASLIYHADLCVAPGNVGLTAMHTMAFGTPVLTHDDFTLQMPEFESIKEGITGNFFKYNDINSLTESIKSWLSEHSSDREKVRHSCYEEIEESWNPEFQLNVLKNHLQL